MGRDPGTSRIYYPQARAILSVVFDGFGESAQDTPPKIIPVVPKTVTVSRNAYNQADGWELTFDADDFPVDPQMVRAGAAEIFLFATRGLRANERLIDKQLNTLDDPAPNREPGDTVLEEMGAPTATDGFTLGHKPMVAGLFDEHSMELSGNGRWVTITGQDYTALLIAKQWPPTKRGRARRIPVGAKLDKLLARLLREADTTGRMELVTEGVGPGDMPTVKAELKSQKRGIAVDAQTTYWDVLYKLATRHGFILFVRGLEVVLTTPANLSNDDTARIRRMAWGRNLESLEMSRRLGKETAPAVVIKAYDDSLREPITVDYPVGSFTKVKKTQRTSKSTGKTSKRIKKTDEYTIVPVYGITNRATLKRMAKTMYYQLGQSERTVRFQTRDLTDLRDKDLMDLAAGDALLISFDEFNVLRALLSNPRVAPEVKSAHLVERGFGEAIAQIVATKYTEMATLDRPLRVREVTYDYDVDAGISIEAEVMDFIIIDGARDAASKPRRKDKKRRRKDGTTLGLDDAAEDALVRQHGGEVEA